MITDDAANKILKAILRNTSYVIATPYLGLFIGLPTATLAGTEVTGTGYSRKALATPFGVDPAGGVIQNSAVATFAGPVTTDWGTAAAPIIAVGIFDASTSGNLILWTDICPQIVLAGDPVPSFKVAGLTVSLNEGGCGC